MRKDDNFKIHVSFMFLIPNTGRLIKNLVLFFLNRAYEKILDLNFTNAVSKPLGFRKKSVFAK